jgi:RND family efflux transporter MFP subunit
MDEGSYLRYVRIGNSGKNESDATNDGGKVEVKLRLIDEQIFSHPGRMDFVDNAIDTSSGTIRGRAVFSNPDGTFTPGMFGRVQVAAAPPAERLLVPDVAVGTEQVRKYVLVVDDQNVAQAKYVTLGPVIDGLRVVQSGLTPNDRVVVSGLMRARPGSKVDPQMSTATAVLEREPPPAR